MSAPGSRRNPESGSTLIESAIVAVVFVLLMVSIMEFGWIGFAYNSVSFAAHRAARFAAVRGSSSGHASDASKSKVEAQALTYIVALNTATALATWPDSNNNPGSTVQVRVSYTFQPLLVQASLLTIQATSKQIIVQ